MFSCFFRGGREASPEASLPSADLYMILPYFNFCKYASRKRLFLEFVERMVTKSGVRLVVVEGALADGDAGPPYELPYPMAGTFAHLRVSLKNVMWCKENLIQLGVRYLPQDWQWMAWVDADVTFANPRWLEDMHAAFEAHDVLQLWETAVNLGPSGEAIRIDRGFAYMHAMSGKPYHPKSKYGQWHPGFAWAIKRSAYLKLGGLIDWAILGSADRHMALAWIGKAEMSAPTGMHAGYKRRLAAFQARAQGLTLGYVPGTILHHWHGSLADRRYVERWNVLVKHGYNPYEDIRYTKNGVLMLTDLGRRMEADIRAYFQGRNEDSVVVPA